MGPEALNFDKEFSKIDHLIKSGRINQAWTNIKKIKISEIPRDNLLVLADLTRRVRQPLYATKILGKIIRNHREKIEEAKTDEILAYCNSLIKLGFFDEAQKWLDKVDSNKHPQVFDLYGRIHATQWNYETASFYFKKWVNSLDPTSYPHLVGQLNLASSLINCGIYEKGHDALENVQRRSKSKSPLIYGNSLELQAQWHIHKKEFAKAKKSIEDSLSILTGSSVWEFYARKWKIIIDLEENPEDTSTLNNAESLLTEALTKDYGEGAREIERALALTTKNQDRLLRVYFGTHFSGYRKKITKQWLWPEPIPDTYYCSFHGGTNEHYFDTKNEFKGKQLAGNLFKVLNLDLYRPLPLGFVFNKLYPGEFFDPFHSADRVYAQVKSLRKSLASELGIEVEWHGGSVQLKYQKPIQLYLHKKVKMLTSSEIQVIDLRNHFKKNWFKSSDIKANFNLSGSSTNRLINQAKTIYKLETQGRGRATRYRFK